MNPLLITGFGTSINVDKRKLIITNRLKDTRLEFYPHKINHDGIIIDGHTDNITFEAMKWISKHSINLTLLNWNGQLLANVMPEQPKPGTRVQKLNCSTSNPIHFLNKKSQKS